MSFSYSGSQSEECVLLENDCLNQDYYENNGVNGISAKLGGNTNNVNKYFKSIRKKRNRKKHVNVTTDYVPMNSASSESVNNTIDNINNNEITINCEGIEIPNIINTGLLGKFFPFGFCYEFKKLVQLAIPITITSLVAFLSGPMGLIFCGQLGKTALATVGLANSIFNVAGLAVITGLLTAVDTLFSQIFGSSNKGLMGIHLQRAIVISFIMCMPSWSLYLCIEPILLGLKQNPLMAKKASEYLLYMIPGLGSAISQSSAYLFQCICYLPYILMLQQSGLTWKGWTNELWLDWGRWFKLAMPGVLMITLEWIVFEMGSIVSGTLGERELATQTILFNIESMCFTLLPLGFGIASSIRVGQFLGARSSLGPRSVVSTALVTLWTASIVFILTLCLLRWKIPMIFTSEQDVIELSAKLLPLIATFQIFDGTVGVCGGAIRGAGLQLFGAIVCFISLYVIGSPISFSLVYAGAYGLEGLWAGMTIGTIFEGVIYLVICQHINWEKQVQLAIERTEELILNVDQMQERSTNQPTEEVQQPTDTKPSSFKDEYVNEEEQIDVQNDVSFRENVTEAGASLVDNFNPPTNEFSPNSQKILSTQLEKVVLPRTVFILLMLFLLSLGIIMRFLTSLHKLFNQSKSSGSLYITMKRYDGRVKPVPKRVQKVKDVHVTNENSCLLRATLGNQKISTVVHQKDMNRFNQAYSNLLKANIDGLKKRDKRVKSTNISSKLNRPKTEKG
ncbi:putative multidrug resistance pump [Schistosoma mansoni]|uniref:putative multidrug resistance pump n=1 Tax=Schistosoma mansoni TaxID=6183 RepID=UPI0001A63DAC|nr:putative multidrug resistance pump [Schistosoma mansoni]|eukprot:XP_018655126.1 putative multidrug resistance pump [Schistosoma mansoni]